MNGLLLHRHVLLPSVAQLTSPPDAPPNSRTRQWSTPPDISGMPFVATLRAHDMRCRIGTACGRCGNHPRACGWLGPDARADTSRPLSSTHEVTQGDGFVAAEWPRALGFESSSSRIQARKIGRASCSSLETEHFDAVPVAQLVVGPLPACFNTSAPDSVAQRVTSVPRPLRLLHSRWRRYDAHPRLTRVCWVFRLVSAWDRPPETPSRECSKDGARSSHYAHRCFCCAKNK